MRVPAGLLSGVQMTTSLGYGGCWAAVAVDCCCPLGLGARMSRPAVLELSLRQGSGTPCLRM